MHATLVSDVSGNHVLPLNPDTNYFPSTPILPIGHRLSNGEIYMGLDDPTYISGQSIRKLFGILCSPTCLTDNVGNPVVGTFDELSEHVGELRNWYGHNGFKVNDPSRYSEELGQCLVDGSAEGLWSIARLEVVSGQFGLHGGSAKIGHHQNLYDLSRAGIVSNLVARSSNVDCRTILTSTLTPGNPIYVRTFNFFNGDDGWSLKDKDGHRGICCLCRYVAPYDLILSLGS